MAVVDQGRLEFLDDQINQIKHSTAYRRLAINRQGPEDNRKFAAYNTKLKGLHLRRAEVIAAKPEPVQKQQSLKPAVHMTLPRQTPAAPKRAKAPEVKNPEPTFAEKKRLRQSRIRRVPRTQPVAVPEPVAAKTINLSSKPPSIRAAQTAARVAPRKTKLTLNKGLSVKERQHIQEKYDDKFEIEYDDLAELDELDEL